MGYAQLVIGPAGSGKVKSFTKPDTYVVGSCCEHVVDISFLFTSWGFSQLIALACINTVKPWDGR